MKNQSLTRVFGTILFAFVAPMLYLIAQNSEVFAQYSQGVVSFQSNEPTPLAYPPPLVDQLGSSFFIYPPPGQMEFAPTAFPLSENSLFVGEPKIFLPLLSKSENSNTHFYAQADKQGTFYGVWGNIETADPVIREPLFSYVSINITGPDGNWIETGWIKASISGCIPKFSWATQEGDGTAHIIDTPLPSVGVTYQYIIERISPGNWKLWINRTDGVVLLTVEIPNAGFVYGDRIQALGEVDSATRSNDMGVSGILSLLWMDIASYWHGWDGWQYGVVDSPYHVVGAPPDETNNVQVYGNNGNPTPPDAPCP